VIPNENVGGKIVQIFSEVSLSDSRQFQTDPRVKTALESNDTKESIFEVFERRLHFYLFLTARDSTIAEFYLSYFFVFGFFLCFR
jgi:hypothetical protein